MCVCVCVAYDGENKCRELRSKNNPEQSVDWFFHHNNAFLTPVPTSECYVDFVSYRHTIPVLVVLHTCRLVVGVENVLVDFALSV